MTSRGENFNFNSRLMIVDHFDDIINQIDIKTETLLEQEVKYNKKRKLGSGADDIRNKLNEIKRRTNRKDQRNKRNQLKTLK